jgi:hypothetical protein
LLERITMSKMHLPVAIAAATLLLPLAGHAQIVVDGTVDSAYGAAKALQNVPTNYGDNTNGTVAPSGGGSELDGAYGVIQNNTLYLTITGNLENNGNVLNLFIGTGAAGGQNVLNNPTTSYNGLSNFNGLKFDTGFTANYDLLSNASGSNLYVDFNNVDNTGTSAYLGTTSTFGAGANGTLTGGTNPGNILAALDDSNTAGVDGSAVNTPGAVMTGAEFAIPLANLGNPTGPLQIVALLAGGGNNGVSNQVLGAAGTGLNGYPSPGTVDFSTIAGSQFFTVPAAAAVPEASTTVSLGLLLAFGLGGLVVAAKRKKQSV